MKAERAEQAGRDGAPGRRGRRVVRLRFAALHIELGELLEVGPGRSGEKDRFQPAVLCRPDWCRVDFELAQEFVGSHVDYSPSG